MLFVDFFVKMFCCDRDKEILLRVQIVDFMLFLFCLIGKVKVKLIVFKQVSCDIIFM